MKAAGLVRNLATVGGMGAAGTAIGAAGYFGGNRAVKEFKQYTDSLLQGMLPPAGQYDTQLFDAVSGVSEAAKKNPLSSALLAGVIPLLLYMTRESGKSKIRDEIGSP